MTHFRVRLLSSGENKLAVVREVRDIARVGLREARELVDGLGVVGENLTRHDAERISQKLASVGARTSVDRTAGSGSAPDPRPRPQPGPGDNRRAGLYRLKLLTIVAEDLDLAAAEKLRDGLEALGAEVRIEPSDTLRPEPVSPVPEPEPEPAGPSDQGYWGDTAFRLEGSVLNSHQRPLPGVAVRVAARSARREVVLGRTITDARGRFTVALGPMGREIAGGGFHLVVGVVAAPTGETLATLSFTSALPTEPFHIIVGG
ncbi:MAG: hypothetical protein EA350_17655 [Gemmatimonadales bacterium]|nr:MAG: hypothetical protein EA350_17655 [Gemmatimonadales bacterium]